MHTGFQQEYQRLISCTKLTIHVPSNKFPSVYNSDIFVNNVHNKYFKLL